MFVQKMHGITVLTENKNRYTYLTFSISYPNKVHTEWRHDHV